MVNHLPDPGALDVLGDPTRRRLLTLLASGPRPASELAERLRISRPAVSRHLRLLRSRGLVEDAAVPGDARMRLCRLRLQPLAEIEEWTKQVQHFWAGQLAAFARYAGARQPPAERGRRSQRASRRRRR